jgi:hypothetical protein
MIAQLLSIFIAYKFSFSEIAEEVYAPFGETVSGAVANSIPFIISIFIFGSLIALLVEFKKFNFIKALLTTAVMFSTFYMNIFLFSTIFTDSAYLPLLISIALSFLVFLAVYFKRLRFLSKFLSLLISAEVAGYLTTILQPPTVFVLPLVLAAYDIYAVFAGPLKKIAGKPVRTRRFSKRARMDFLSLLIIDFKVVKIGLGDIVFYSMLPATAFMLYGIGKMLLTILTTNIGVVLTLFLLQKKKIPLPGLPVPMLLGVLTIVL